MFMKQALGRFAFAVASAVLGRSSKKLAVTPLGVSVLLSLGLSTDFNELLPVYL